MAEHAGEEVEMAPAALRHRDFRHFWGRVVFSGFGGQVTTVALAWQRYELTHSAWRLAYWAWPGRYLTSRSPYWAVLWRTRWSGAAS